LFSDKINFFGAMTIGKMAIGQTCTWPKILSELAAQPSLPCCFGEASIRNVTFDPSLFGQLPLGRSTLEQMTN
jgi:hypothetical protein